MSHWPSYRQPEPLNLDSLRLVHARSDLNHVSLDAQGNAAIHNRPHERKPFENTMHFTLNAVVDSHAYGNFDRNHCVIISPLRETVALGNSPEGLLAADTYFHADANSNVTVPAPVMFAPEGMEVPRDLEPHVRRYPRGLTDEETHLFKKRAVGDWFDAEGLPFHNVGYDDWVGAADPQRGQKIQEELGFAENRYRGRHMHSPSYEFGGTMRHLYENLERLRSGERYVRDHWGRDENILEVIGENASYLQNFIQGREQAGDAPNAMAFYRKHAGEYDTARVAALTPAYHAPPPPTA